MYDQSLIFPVKSILLPLTTQVNALVIHKLKSHAEPEDATNKYIVLHQVDANHAVGIK